MAFIHTTRRGTAYYLHTGPKRGGGVQHFLSTKKKGTLAAALPEGFEIYETVNGLAFLRRKRPSAIRDEELAVVRGELAKHRGPMLHEIEVTGGVIVIHEAEGAQDHWRALGALRPGIDLAALTRQFAQFMPVMRFALHDEERRLFAPERYCFRGSVDDWISIGETAAITALARKFIPHLGKDTFYELY